MLFHSLTFWLFFTVLVAAYRRLELRGQNVLLLLASNFFYAWWDWRFLPFMWLPIVVDYHVARRLSSTTGPRRRRLLLMVSLSSGLGSLFFFKYFAFVAGEFYGVARLVGWQFEVPAWIGGIVMPIGISFYTFQTLSFVVDVYRRRAKPVESLFDYALFCSFFPQLLAGPIERGHVLLPQLLTARPRVDGQRFAEGLYHLITGVFKKVVIADNMALLVNHLFLPGAERTGWEVLLAAYAFAFQIYGDFSGYSSISQGIARWLGFELSWNFKLPYLATSPQMFWQRWHITLSTWLRDYLFMPLMSGGWMKGIAKVYVVTLCVQLCSGVWHGANWTFLCWGVLHGFYMSAQLWLARRGWFREPAPDAGWIKRLPFIVLTFHLMGLGMIFFRADSMTQVVNMLSAMGGDWHLTPLLAYGFSMLTLLALPLMLFECWIESKKDQLALLKVAWQLRAAVYTTMVFMIWFLPPEKSNEFIYFQF